MFVRQIADKSSRHMWTVGLLVTRGVQMMDGKPTLSMQWALEPVTGHLRCLWRPKTIVSNNAQLSTLHSRTAPHSVPRQSSIAVYRELARRASATTDSCFATLPDPDSPLHQKRQRSVSPRDNATKIAFIMLLSITTIAAYGSAYGAPTTAMAELVKPVRKTT